MVQIYFLTIAVTLLSGIVLSADLLGQKLPFFEVFKDFRDTKKSAVPLGLVTAIIGLLKLILRSPGEAVPVAGDLLPALTAISLGIALIGEAFPKETKNGEEVTTTPRWPLLAYRNTIGITGMVVALMHFILPGVVIL